MRLVPQLTPENEWFWASGTDGRLRVQGCRDCATLVHPPVPICAAVADAPTAVVATGGARRRA